MNIAVGPYAFALPLLHAAKYPDALVCGVLLGQIKTDGSMEITTGIPFFHHWTSLTPMLEVALQQVMGAAKERKLKVLGWYQANTNLKDATIHESAIRVADAIKRNSGQAIVLIVRSISTLYARSIIFAPPYIFHEKDWRPVKGAFTKDSSVVLSYEETYPKVRGMFSSAQYQRLVDFDDHLEDVSKSWLEYSNHV
ncbi:hypothetical protein BX666DRAFT_1865025 [Dichotomocladium elegans]|nr:hypothetical protein BX666DRAFT_1865025 [Dichotomocladium elegans]